jgi:hypothetical protein
MSKNRYVKFNLNLDPDDEKEAKLIQFLKDKKGNKTKNSYSAILKLALEELMKKDSLVDPETANKL